MPQERLRALEAARAAGGDERLVRRGGDRLRLQAFERRGQRNGERERRHRQVPREIGEPLRPSVRSMPPEDVMPPTGNHPVRAARNTSASEPISGGTDMPSTDSARTIDRPRPRVREPE